MQVQDYINNKKQLHELLLDYIDYEYNNDESNDYFFAFTMFTDKNILNNQDDVKEFIHLISNICLNHHRYPSFNAKIRRILIYIKDHMKSFLSDSDIFDLFKSNIQIIIFLFDMKVIKINQYIFNCIFNKTDVNDIRLYHYFYPEIKDFIDASKRDLIEYGFIMNGGNDYTNFNKKRNEGENDSYICYLIRNDMIEEFVEYTVKHHIRLNELIMPSIFESNHFLIKNQPNLIEYAAFFGSIQTFQYLLFNNVEINQSLWMYAIHGKNAEIIHILEANNIYPKDENIINYIKESIKCHHNDITKYLIDNYIISNENNINDIIIKYGFHYHNYEFIEIDFNQKNILCYLCEKGYIQLVKYFIENINCIQEYRINDAFELALKNNCYEIVNYLISQNKVNFKTKWFKGCNNISQLIIPALNMEIPAFAFQGCSSLRKISIPSSITITTTLFPVFNSPTNISITYDIDSIENSTFENCNSLCEYKIPESVISIGHNSFKNCSSLREIIIPTKVISIGNLAFKGCSFAERIIVPDSVKEIGFNAFEDCKSITEISIPPDLLKIESFLFSGCSLLRNIVIPSSVISIGKCSFKGCSSLTHVIIPQSVIEIGESSFEDCTSLTEIIIPLSVTYIGACTFKNNHSLKKINLPCCLKFIGEYTFYKCSSLIKIEISSTVTNIGDYCFYNCSKLKQISIPSNLKSLGNFVFAECISLEKIIIPSSVEQIGFNAFNKCSSLIEIILPSELNEIKSSTFSGCTNLKHIRIPSSVTKIEDLAFNRCFSLKRISIPYSVNYIGSYVFGKCKSLIQISIPSSFDIKSIGISSRVEIIRI